MTLKKQELLWLVLITLLFSICNLTAQSKIYETVETIKTYPYGDPNMIPAMGVDQNVARYYPYYVFDGYTSIGEDRDWKVIVMENPFIQVKVLPELGGKVMGAIEKFDG